MKISLAFLFASIVATSAQDVNLRERLLEHRADQFRDNNAKLSFIKEHHEQRMTRLEQMIEERRRMTEEHESGRRRLSDEEYERANRQYRNFQRKLEHMQKRTEEDHRERLQELEHYHNMNRIDYLDIKEKVGDRNWAHFWQTLIGQVNCELYHDVHE